MKDGVFHVIMAGGSGTRFWPVSRAGRPKQFLSLVGDRSLLKQAYERASAMSGAESVYVAAGLAQKEMVLAELAGLAPSRFIAEPVARNTAPCVGLAALRLRRVSPDAVMIVWPADHVYTDAHALEASLDLAVGAAARGTGLVTLGIQPARPETGYGYIEVEAAPKKGAAAGSLPDGVRRAIRFVEKPDLATARGYLAAGGFLWNSGLFIWRIDAILRAIESCAPDLWAGLAKIDAALGGADEERVIREVFASAASISIDYAVLEKAAEVLVVPVDPGWSDVGSWDAVADLHATDAAGNAQAGTGNAGAQFISIGSRDCFVFSGGDSRRALALVGVEDLIVVDTGDAVLVCRKGDSQSVRAVVEALKAMGREDLL